MERLKIKTFYTKKDKEENSAITLECSQDIDEAIEEARYAFLDGEAVVFSGDKEIYRVNESGETIYNEALLEYSKVS